MIGAAILPAAIPRLYAPVQAAERAAASPPAADGSYFMPLERFVIPIFQDGQIARHLFIVVQLHVADLKAGERIREYMPRLTDAFLRDLHTLASRTHASFERKLS
ncbi:MAG: hypothetical protein HY057_08490 [Rhodospirillales bacterium]|nr:hypothetical protein [Rhodospirillales bacterium]